MKRSQRFRSQYDGSLPAKLPLLAVALVLMATAPAAGVDDPNAEFDGLAQKCLALGLTGFAGAAEGITDRLQELADGPLKGQPLRQAEAKGYRAFILTQLGRFDESEKLYLEALAIGDKLLPEVHPKRSLIHQGLAHLYVQTGRHREAEPLLKQAVAIAEKAFAPDDPEVARSVGNLANVYLAKGNYAEAERLLRRAEAIYLERLDEDLVRAHVTDSGLGFLYLMEGRYGEAQRRLERSLEARKKTYGEHHPYVLVARAHLGLLYRRQHKYADAEGVWKESLKTLDLTNPRSAVVFTELGRVYIAQDRSDEAVSMFERALTIQQKGLPEDHPDTASTLLGIARAEMGQGDATQAVRRLDDAIAIFERSGINDRDYWECYCLRASLAWSLGDRARAVEYLKRAIALSEQQRTQFTGGGLERAQAFAQYTNAFETMVAWQRKVGDIHEALDAMERGRGRSLIDQMTARGVDLLAGLPKAEAERLSRQEREAQLRVASLSKKLEMLEQQILIWPGKRAAKRKELQMQLRNARRAWVESHSAIRSASPAYRLAVSADLEPVTLDRLAEYVDRQEGLLLQYLLGDEGGYVLVVPAGGPSRLEALALGEAQAERLHVEPGPVTAKRMHDILMRQDQTGVVDHLRASGDYERSQKQRSQELAKAVEGLAVLWEVLVPEAERKALVEGQYKRLVALPDAALAMLPFETLVVERGERPRDHKYLLDVGPPIIYAPSATILVNLAERQEQAHEPAEQPVLSIGDCRYGPSAAPPDTLLADLAPQTRYAATGGHLAPLKYAAWEVQWVADVFQKRGVQPALLRGDAAREAAVRRFAPGRRILHFATHGLVDQQYGNLFGALALTPGPRPDDPADDGFLTLAEIYELDLAGCELAILSACDTNVGPHQRGEGVWSLARGFLTAGARRVAATTWLLDDRVAASTVSYFCAGIARQKASGGPVDYAAALHEAKRWARSQEKWSAPYYWAPMVLIGPQ